MRQCFQQRSARRYETHPNPCRRACACGGIYRSFAHDLRPIRANVDAMKAEHFNDSNYEDLKFIYEMVMKRNHISANEMQAIAAELGNLRK